MVTIDEARGVIDAESAAILAERHYAHIASQDGMAGKAINSFLALSRERALRQVERIDELARRGEGLPSLAGVPMGIKDVLAMEGAPATAGSKILEGYRPPYDATVVKKLEAAGAVLLGKLNCDEFAMGSSNENSCLWAGAQSKGARPGSWRFQWRVGGGGCGWLLRRDAGDGYWGVDPAACGVLRRGWGASDLWARQPIWIDRLRFLAGSGWAICRVCEGCGDGSRRNRGEG